MKRSICAARTCTAQKLMCGRAMTLGKRLHLPAATIALLKKNARDSEVNVMVKVEAMAEFLAIVDSAVDRLLAKQEPQKPVARRRGRPPKAR